jgi:hypothetical protein
MLNAARHAHAVSRGKRPAAGAERRDDATNAKTIRTRRPSLAASFGLDALLAFPR